MLALAFRLISILGDLNVFLDNAFVLAKLLFIPKQGCRTFTCQLQQTVLFNQQIRVPAQLRCLVKLFILQTLRQLQFEVHIFLLVKLLGFGNHQRTQTLLKITWRQTL